MASKELHFGFQIREQLEDFEISVYQFPRDEDEPESSDISSPFGVVGSNVVMEDKEGKLFRGRRYPWGCVNIEDEVRILSKMLVLIC